jgi:hypothetical protein
MSLSKTTKIKFFDYAYDANKFTVDVEVRGGSREWDYHGRPEVFIYEENDQIIARVGCIRVSYNALWELVQMMENGERGLIQQGTYKSKDPDDSTTIDNS